MYLKSLCIGLFASLLVGSAASAAVKYDLEFNQTSGTPMTISGSLVVDQLPPAEGEIRYDPKATEGYKLLRLDLTIDGVTFKMKDDLDYADSAGRFPALLFVDGVFCDLNYFVDLGYTYFFVDLDDFGTTADGVELNFLGKVTPQLAGTVVPIPAALPLAASAFGSLGGIAWLKRRRTSTVGAGSAGSAA